LGRRQDGFHDLESLFLALAWGDTLNFEVLPGKNGCEVLMDRALPQGENLIAGAVRVFREATGFNASVRIGVKKRLPAGAGLGGGSSDAAAVLKALDLLGGTSLGEEKLGALALVLGSDVPFFLGSGAAFVSGRGEILEPLTPPRGIWLVLVKPDFSSSTPQAFALLDRVREAGGGAECGLFPGTGGLPETGRELLIGALPEDPGTWPYTNDFLGLFIEHGPRDRGAVYSRIMEDLRGLGAAFTGLSGSGSTCFGVFKEKKAAERAGRALRSLWNLVKITFPLRRGEWGIKIV
jgi:4-diphosphocytidyl-2-C-methyl-D-erythritol kinase